MATGRRGGNGPLPALFAAIALIAACQGGDEREGVEGTLSSPGEATAGERGDGGALARMPLRIERAFPRLRFDSPVGLLQAPDGSWLVLEKGGKIKRFPNEPDPGAAGLVVDLSDRVESAPSEAGLLGLAFHADFSRNGEVFLSYTRRGSPLVSVISRFTSTDGGRSIDPASERQLLTLEQPYANHNGGHLLFGPDRYLYIGFGDGGSAGDPHGHGQNRDTLLGTILRIDPSRGSPYAIPPDNPFARGGGRPEIFAYGLRNPWRFSFDRATGSLWAGDVGQYRWEEVDLIVRGGNYGWNVREGAHCYLRRGCDREGLIDPVAEYGHAEGCSITGGHVYRGSAIAALRGFYLYGDFCSGRVWALPVAARGGRRPELLARSSLAIASFAEDSAGEIYIVDFGGTIHRIVAQRNR